MRALVALLVVPLACLTACGGPAMQVEGSITLEDINGVDWAEDEAEGAECAGADGYDDIHEGTKVAIRNSAGEQVGLGELDQGSGTPAYNPLVEAFKCEFTFTIEDVEGGDDSKFTVEVGERGEVPFDRDDAAFVEITLG